jgi:hypothetical protein
MRKGLFALVASAVVLWPAGAGATTVTMGYPEVPAGMTLTVGCTPCTGFTVAQGFTPDGQVNFAPAAGLITSWRVAGEGTLKLSVLESVEGGGWVAVGTSAAATNTEDQPNATSLPIGFDDLIALQVGPSQNHSAVKSVKVEDGQQLEWAPPLTPGEMAEEPNGTRLGWRLGLSADVVLAPVLSSLGPTSGSTAGGNAVKIAGKYLDGAAGVTFRSTPASSFSVDSPNQITAIAPATAASTVDVRVTGPGGSSEVTSADKYTFTAPATSPAPTTLAQLVPALAAKPAVTGLSESASRWRRGHSLPHISSVGAPLGTTFSFSLSEPATSTFTFTQRMAGRRAHGKCAAPSPGNAHGSKCKRTVVVGSVGIAGKAGLNKLRFQGRLSGAKTLKPGAYAVSVTASDAHGLKAVSQSLSFTIVS